MNIYEQILAGLQTKFPGADTATLQRIASSKSAGVTDEGQVQAIVDAVTFMDVMKNYGDRRADDASKTAVNTYEQKYNIKDGKSVENQQQQQTQQQQQQVQQPPQTQQQVQQQQQQVQQPQDLATAIATALGTALKPITDRLDKMEGASAQAAFDAKVDAVAKTFGIPEYAYKGRVIDPKTDLNVYFTDLKQTMINQGYKFPAAPESGGGTDKPGQAFADWTKEGTQQIINQQTK